MEFDNVLVRGDGLHGGDFPLHLLRHPDLEYFLFGDDFHGDVFSGLRVAGEVDFSEGSVA